MMTQGDEFVHGSNDMFGFALWDARRRRLLLGRDRLGVKPLYIAQDSRCLAFATEAKALLKLPWLGTEPGPRCVGGLPFTSATCPRRTACSAASASCRRQRCCRWSEGTCASGAGGASLIGFDTTASESDWVERIRTGIDASVARQMVSDVPIGAFLSGGIDSSAVVAAMARHSGHPIRTYAIGFEGAAAERLYNELPYARRVADLFGTEHHEIVVKPDVVRLIPPVLWRMDEPLADSAFITTYLVSEFARRDVKVILSGVGGDELFGGYRRYLGGYYSRRYSMLPAWARRLASATVARLPADRHSKWLNLVRLAKGFIASADMDADTRYRSYVRVLAREAVAALVLADPSAGDDRLGSVCSRRPRRRENRMLAVDAEAQLPDDLLLLTDKMSMAVSLECRVPLLDHELVEMAAAIPGEVKVRDGRLKNLTKSALTPTLPPATYSTDRSAVSARPWARG